MLFTKPWHSGFGFHVVEKEAIEHSATATEHAVERGANVSDHLRTNLSTISLDVFVSNAPIRDVNNLYDGQVAGLELNVPSAKKSIAPMPGSLMNAGLDALASALDAPQTWKALVMQYPTKFNAVRDTLERLIDWQQRAVVGQVITPHRTYENVYITNIKMMRDATTGDGAPITIDFKEIRFVESKVVFVPVPTEIRGKSKVNLGKQPTVPVSDSKLESMLSKGTDYVKGLLKRR